MPPSTEQKKTAGKNAAPTHNSPAERKSWFSVGPKAFYLVCLAAFYAPLSQLILSPVYGSIPSEAYHKYGLTAATLLAFALRSVIPRGAGKLLSPFAFWIPSLHFSLFKFSNAWGFWGPLYTELATTFPLIILSMATAMKLVEGLQVPFIAPESNLAEAAPPMVLFLVFSLAQRFVKSALPSLIGGNFFTTRIGMQLSIATLYGLLLPQSWFLPALPSIAFTMIANPHNSLQRTTDVLNNTLSLYNYTLLERRESVTGYVSVLDDHTNGFRAMRCDHSLLGGEWKIAPKAGAPIPKVGEPIYAVFTMLEAVRLVETPTSSLPDSKKTALNIGLGVGTAPSAMIAHGMNVTVLELDPVVHEFAVKYFNLPDQHQYVIGDALEFVNARSREVTRIAEKMNIKNDAAAASLADSSLQYDYIFHDIFTGGAMPTALLTRTFLKSLAKLLKPTGVIAINFAGDLDLPSAPIVYRTITSAFPTCRVFREDEEKSVLEKILPNRSKARSADQAERVAAGRDKVGDEAVYTGDFTNLVFFCLSPQAPPELSSVTFRRSTPDDWLDSAARKFYMTPRHEFDAEGKWSATGTAVYTGGVDAMMEWVRESVTGEDRVLDVGKSGVAKVVDKYQQKSAMGHWRLMRTVIRPEIWENW